MKKLAKEKHSREQNKKYRTLVKNDKKKIVTALTSGTTASKDVLRLYQNAQSNLDKSVTKKVLHKNSAARKKSLLFRMLNSDK